MLLGRTVVNICRRSIPRFVVSTTRQPKSFHTRNMSSGIARSGPPLNTEEMRIVWMDLEMTGLDPDKDSIIELACAITDSDLKLVAEHEMVIHQPDEVLENMNEWCTKQHTESGLVEKVKNSKTSLAEAETATLDFIKQYVMPQMSPLAGNSVHMDKFFLMKQMPLVTNYLHYRIIDVSTVKELARRWNPSVFNQANRAKKQCHRARDDILESIQELRLYRDLFMTSTK